MISVVIPAYNEEAVIERGLRALTSGAADGELEIIVVCNNTTDRTAELARAVDPSVRVIETPTPGKANALNLGDEAAGGFPRFYVDADVVMDLATLRRVAQELESGNVLAAAPEPRFDVTGASYPVKAFYRVWRSIPYFDDTMIGTGVYAVNEAGRARFDRFPEIIADDAFVRLSFSPDERRCVRDVSFTVTAPKTAGGVIAIKTRARAGNYELRQKFPELTANETSSPGATVRHIMRSPRLWFDGVIYLTMMFLAKRRAEAKLRRNEEKQWERDETSRTGAPVAGR